MFPQCSLIFLYSLYFLASETDKETSTSGCVVSSLPEEETTLSPEFDQNDQNERNEQNQQNEQNEQNEQAKTDELFNLRTEASEILDLNPRKFFSPSSTL